MNSNSISSNKFTVSLKRWMSLFLLGMALSACGGGDKESAVDGAPVAASDDSSEPTTEIEPPVEEEDTDDVGIEPNSAPTADAGANVSAEVDSILTLMARGNDNDGEIVSRVWKQLSGPEVELTAMDEASAMYVFVAPSTDGEDRISLEFELTVEDDDGATATDRVLFNILAFVDSDCGKERTNPVVGKPDLEPGIWTDITPKHLGLGSNVTMIAQGIAVDPCDPSILYWGNTPFDTNLGGLFKSIDGGSSWVKFGEFDAPIRVRIDPENNQHLYVGAGVRGANTGFWVSWDGGATWKKPEGWSAVQESIGLTKVTNDVYDVAVDPDDFYHILVSFHSPWAWNRVNTDQDKYEGAGVVESWDGGNTWIAHLPSDNWGQGHSINFLYDPDNPTGIIGDDRTWLLGTQGKGYWRTDNAGESWTQVSEVNIYHGGGTVHYTDNGMLYASGSPSGIKSEDNGKNWIPIGPRRGTTCIFGDGVNLWTGATAGSGTPYIISDVDDGETWEPYNNGDQTWDHGGPFEMVLDSVNGILYSSNWEQGAMAMKLPYPVTGD